MIPQTHHIKSKETTYNYMLFDSVRDFNAFTDGQIKFLSNKNSSVWNNTQEETRNNIRYGSDWYGRPVPKGIQELEDHRAFLGMHLVKEIQPKIRKHLSQYLDYLSRQVMPKQKFAYNDKGLGLFSFDRAAMGLFKASKINISTPLDKTSTQLNIELGRTNLLTNIKEVYAYFKNKQISYPALRLYILAGANAYVDGDQLLYAGLACGELIEFLELRNVPVEVNILLGTYFNSQVSMGVIRVKRFQDKADKNQLLLMSSDPRYFRYRGFKSLIALSNHFNLTIPDSLGRIEANMGYDFVQAIGENGFVFEQSYSLNAAAKEVSRIIETYNERIKNAKRA